MKLVKSFTTTKDNKKSLLLKSDEKLLAKVYNLDHQYAAAFSIINELVDFVVEEANKRNPDACLLVQELLWVQHMLRSYANGEKSE